MDKTDSDALARYVKTLYPKEPKSDTEVMERISNYSEQERSDLVNLIKQGLAYVNNKQAQKTFTITQSRRIKELGRLLLDELPADTEPTLGEIFCPPQVISDQDIPGPSSAQASTSQPMPSSSSIAPGSATAEVPLDNNAPSKRKVDDTFDVEQPKNLKYSTESRRSSHIFPWQSTGDRGFGIEVTSPEYQKGMTTELIKAIEENFGRLINLTESDSMATIVVDREENQKKLIELINNKETGLIATSATYRFPIIKVWIDKKFGGGNWNAVADDMKAFNLKGRNMKDKTFEYWKTFGNPYAQFVLMAIKIDPMVRDHIVRVLNGKLWYKGRLLEVIDHFSLRKCYNCGSCRHWSCTSKQERCLRCSGPHNIRICASPKPLCPACRGEHEAFHIECPQMKEAIERQMEKVDYTYTDIMWARGF